MVVSASVVAVDVLGPLRLLFRMLLLIYPFRSLPFFLHLFSFS